MKFDFESYNKSWQQLQHDSLINRSPSSIPLLPLAVFPCLDSTNIKLWELIDARRECPIGAIALQQTAGKGQWGHSWVSDAGGLYLSVGLDLNLELVNYPHLVMATAWGIATVLRYYQLPVTIKWFNDLILDCHKLGGIKIETRNHKNKLINAVVGVGINWHNSVTAPGINLKSYYQNKDIKKISSLEQLIAIASYGILLGYEYYLAEGIEKLLARYSEICNSIGKQINVDGCKGEVIGVTVKGKLKVKLRSPGATATVELAPGQISLGYE